MNKNILILFTLVICISCQKSKEERLELESDGLEITEKKIVEKDETRVVDFTDAPQRLAKWFRYQQKNNPDFSVSNFHPIDTIEQGEFMIIEFKKPASFSKFMVYSPNKEKALDLYSYGNVLKTKSDGKVEVVAGSPDSQILLFDEETGIAKRLIFCGTTCNFDDGYWINNNEVVVSGAMEGKNMEKRLSLWHINLEQGRIVVFQNLTAEMKTQSELYSDIYFNE